ncbi:MAG: DinB family protein [Candidatus Eisenbacteria bacterium]
MTAEVNRLDEQLRRALEGKAWHGPSVLELLAGVSAAQAAGHPIAGAHSIWELVLHLSSDYEVVLRRLAGDGRPLTAAEDWPTCPAPTEENWQQTVRDLTRRNEELRRAVRAFPEERLDDLLVAASPYTAYTQFIGVTQHNLYHAGQIALLKRAFASATKASTTGEET